MPAGNDATDDPSAPVTGCSATEPDVRLKRVRVPKVVPAVPSDGVAVAAGGEPP